VVPGDDPTLLFTNAGMNQFKDVFLGFDKRPYSARHGAEVHPRRRQAQRPGKRGLHRAPPHLLRDAGQLQLRRLLQARRHQLRLGVADRVHFKLPKPTSCGPPSTPKTTRPTTSGLKDIGLPPERIVRIGDNKGGRYMSDNFWMMGDTGPCGPCSEIFYDHGPDMAGGPPGSPEQDGDRYIEIWNNVFMQFNRTEDGVMHKLPKPSVDTGMGLERLAAVLQHVHSNYEIDLFVRLLAAAKNAVEFGAGGTGGAPTTPSLKVIADHIRACTFTVADGVIPGNEGRGYVLRRIARRAIRHGYKLGARKPVLPQAGGRSGGGNGRGLSRAAREHGAHHRGAEAEEERFFQTIATAWKSWKARWRAAQRCLIDGDVAFKLHDTYGFPLDLTGRRVPRARCDGGRSRLQRRHGRQREQARAAGKFKMAAGLEYSGAATTFHGYEHLVCEPANVTPSTWMAPR
jgi:alanyl-tRNA synthetase